MTTVACLMIGCVAAGDYTHASIQNVTEEVNAPPGLVTIRIRLHFDDPDDQLLAVGASHSTRPLTIRTTDPLGFRNDAGVFLACAKTIFQTLHSEPHGTPGSPSGQRTWLGR